MNPHVEALREWCKNREAAGPIDAILGTLEAYAALQSQHDEAVAACAVMLEALKPFNLNMGPRINSENYEVPVEDIRNATKVVAQNYDCGHTFLERMKEAEWLLSQPLLPKMFNQSELTEYRRRYHAFLKGGVK